MTVTKVTCGRRSDADRKPVVSPKGERFSIPDSEETGQEIPMGAGRPPLHFVRAGRECISNSSLLDSLPVRPSYPPAEIAFSSCYSLLNSELGRTAAVLRSATAKRFLTDARRCSSTKLWILALPCTRRNFVKFLNYQVLTLANTACTKQPCSLRQIRNIGNSLNVNSAKVGISLIFFSSASSIVVDFFHRCNYSLLLLLALFL